MDMKYADFLRYVEELLVRYNSPLLEREKFQVMSHLNGSQVSELLSDKLSMMDGGRKALVLADFDGDFKPTKVFLFKDGKLKLVGVGDPSTGFATIYE